VHGKTDIQHITIEAEINHQAMETKDKCKKEACSYGFWKDIYSRARTRL